MEQPHLCRRSTGIVSTVGLFTALILGGGLEAVEPLRRGTGLKEMMPAEEARMLQSARPATGQRLEARGLARWNAERRRAGLAPMAGPGQELQAAMPAPVSAVDNSAEIWFPVIGDQGAVNSCVSWGITYYALSYEVCLLKGWAAKVDATTNDLNRVFSPKWTYNLVNDGLDDGSYITDTMRAIMNHGAAPLAAWPYNDNYRAWCLTPQTWKDAIRWRIANFFWIPGMDQLTGISQAKLALQNGRILPFATYVTSWRSTVLGNDPATAADDGFAGEQVCDYIDGTAGAHIMTIVGYNDDLWCDINRNGTVEVGEKGAFKVANSWGTGDWNQGFRWLAYDAFATVSRVVPAPVQPNRRMVLQTTDSCYYIEAADNQPTLYLRATLSHARRHQMALRMGISAAGASAPVNPWNPVLFENRGGPYAFDGGTTAVDGTFYLDFSRIIDNDVLPNRRYWLTFNDDTVGSPLQIKEFSIETPAGTRISSTNIPATGIDAASGSAWIEWRDNHAPVATDTTFTIGDGVVFQGVLPAADDNDDALTWSVVTPVDRGTFTLVNTATGAFSYVVPAPYTGSTSLTFRVFDGLVYSNTATATLAINHVNHAPVAQASGFTVSMGRVHAGTCTATDADGDAVTFRVVTQGTKGTAAITNPSTGAFTYTPSAEGNDSFQIVASDGVADSAAVSVAVRIEPANHLPVATEVTMTMILGETRTGTLRGTDGDGDALTFRLVTQGTKGTATLVGTAGSYRYVATALGSDQFTFAVHDGVGESAPARVQVTIQAAPSTVSSDGGGGDGGGGCGLGSGLAFLAGGLLVTWSGLLGRRRRRT